MRVTCDGRERDAHLPNSGRLAELLTPGNTVLLAPAGAGAGRKTSDDLLLVKVGGVLVSADARLPNKLLKESIEAGALPEFRGYSSISVEATLGASRIDLRLSGPHGQCYIEAKSVTLVEDGTALFPDAPTTRGRRHLVSLSEAVEQGHRAAVAFVVQCPDVQAFSPNGSADPEFACTLQGVSRRGVEVYAYRCKVSRDEVLIIGRIPVLLE